MTTTRTVVEVVEVPSLDGEERMVVVERDRDDDERRPGLPESSDVDPDVDPVEDYARYGDGPSSTALATETVMEDYLAQECLDAGRLCTSDLQCCGVAVCRPPQGSIGGIFRCRES